ncbi:MAG: hypothetical protein HKN21_16805, partial [Candidatus Eisenbacteria bacterium]|nr:hypothetical protein [Candidatus Eisenbacteria bacterium]
MDPLRVLLIQYHVPPRQSIAARRASHMLQVFGSHGVTPILVTPPPGGEGLDMEVVPLSGWDPMGRGGKSAPSDGSGNGQEVAAASAAPAPNPASGKSGPQKRVKTWLRSWMVPDERFALVKPWVRAARSVLHRVDAIYSSSSPYTTHVVARRLALESGLPWIMEMRDQWVGNPYLAQAANTFSRSQSARLERQCVTTASSVVVLTEAHRNELQSRYKGQADHVHVVRNMFAPRTSASADRTQASTFRLFYAGNLYGERRLDGLGAAVATAKVPGYEVAALEIAGASYDKPFEVTVGTRGVRLLGTLKQSEVEEHLGQVHVGVIHNPSWDKVHIPGKLFEYLASGIPVLDLGTQAEVASLCEGTVPYAQVSQDDPVAIENALARFADWWEENPRGNPPAADHPSAVSARGAEFMKVFRGVALPKTTGAAPE